MEFQGIHYRTVWFENNSVFFIDQNRLPFEFLIREVTSCQECCVAIREMLVRGAGAIGAMAGFAMALAFNNAPENDLEEYTRNAREEIESTRPTARNLFYATERVFKAGMKSRFSAIDEAQKIAEKDAADSQSIGTYGNELIRNGMQILTHCNAGWLAFVDYGTALSPIYTAHLSGKKIFVYVDETRPRSQGARLTAWELHQAAIPHAIIPDNAAAYFMSLGKIDMVITGADRIAMNGDAANKIGTLEKAILAREYGIPFYIAASVSTIDPLCRTGKEITIEERNGDEVLYIQGPDENGVNRKIRIGSPGSHALNPAFDVTPVRYITGIITEKGIILPTKPEILRVVELG